MKACNDKLQNHNTELEHGNSILKMENDIVGERLKVLYNGMEQLVGKRFLENICTCEILKLKQATQKLNSFQGKMLIDLKELAEAKD